MLQMLMIHGMVICKFIGDVAWQIAIRAYVFIRPLRLELFWSNVNQYRFPIIMKMAQVAEILLGRVQWPTYVI